MNAIEQLIELKASIQEADTNDFHNGAEHWAVKIDSIIQDLKVVGDQMEKDTNRITELQNQIDEMEECSDDWDDDPRIAVEVNGLHDQMKLEYLSEVFSQYTFAEIESLLPKR